jgi:hypothetical protein
MNKVSSLCHRYRHDPTKDRAVKNLSRHMIAEILRIAGVRVKITNFATFFNAMILYTSLVNKESFETTFERQRKDLADLWETLSRQEKNLLANTRLDEVKLRLTSFIGSQGDRIWIACFDELLNALYDKRISIFDLDQYFKLYTGFKSRMIPVEHYGLAPFEQSFINITVLDVREDSVLFAYLPLKTAIRVTCEERSSYHYDEIPLDPQQDPNGIENRVWSALHEAWCTQNTAQVMSILVDHELADPRVMRKLRKWIKKLA